MKSAEQPEAADWAGHASPMAQVVHCAVLREDSRSGRKLAILYL